MLTFTEQISATDFILKKTIRKKIRKKAMFNPVQAPRPRVPLADTTVPRLTTFPSLQPQQPHFLQVQALL